MSTLTVQQGAGIEGKRERGERDRHTEYSILLCTPPPLQLHSGCIARYCALHNPQTHNHLLLQRSASQHSTSRPHRCPSFALLLLTREAVNLLGRSCSRHCSQSSNDTPRKTTTAVRRLLCVPSILPISAPNENAYYNNNHRCHLQS